MPPFYPLYMFEIQCASYLVLNHSVRNDDQYFDRALKRCIQSLLSYFICFRIHNKALLLNSHHSQSIIEIKNKFSLVFCSKFKKTKVESNFLNGIYEGK